MTPVVRYGILHYSTEEIMYVLVERMRRLNYSGLNQEQRNAIVELMDIIMSDFRELKEQDERKRGLEVEYGGPL